MHWVVTVRGFPRHAYPLVSTCVRNLRLNWHVIHVGNTQPLTREVVLFYLKGDILKCISLKRLQVGVFGYSSYGMGWQLSSLP